MTQLPEKSEKEDGVEYQTPTVEAEEDELGISGDEHALVSETGEEGSLDIEVEVGAVIDRIAEDTYDNDNVAIRELVANAETACKVASKTESDYTPVIEIEYQVDGTLRVYDNGVGIESRVFDKVVRHIARTTTANEGDMSGQMGMGMFSVRNIMEDGAKCTITTRSRKTDEEYKMYMKSTEFEPIPGGFTEDGKYGTEFVIPVKDRFDESKIRHSIKKYTEFMDVPVIYTMYDRNGDREFQEEYGQKNFEDQYDDGSITVTYEDEYVKAVMSSDAEQKTTLCNMPIARNDNNGRSYRSGGGCWTRQAPMKWDLKVKHEDGRVWDVDHPKMDIDEIRCPEPTSDRDRLSTHTEEDKFFKAVSIKLREEYKDVIGESLQKVDTKQSILDLVENNPNEFHLVNKAVAEIREYGMNPNRLQEKAKEEMDADIEEEAAELLFEINDKDVEIAPRGTSQPNKKDNRNTIDLDEVLIKARDGRVFMGKTVNKLKAKVAWDMDDGNQVVRLDRTQSYEKYERLFGWDKLKNIDVDEEKDDLSANLQEIIETSAASNANKDAKSRKVVVRRRKKAKLRVDNIVEQLNEGELKTTSYKSGGDSLILFGYDSDKKISKWERWLGKVGTHGATISTRMVEDYLEQHADDDSIMHIDKLANDAKEIEVTTTEGDVKLGENNDRLILHAIHTEELLERFRQDDLMEEMQNIVEDKFGYKFDGDTEPLYAPIPRDGGLQLETGIKDMKITVIDYDSNYDFRGCSTTIDEFNSTAEVFTVARLKNWDKDSDEVQFIREAANFNDETEVLNPIDMYAVFHDAGVKPVDDMAGEVDLEVNGHQASLGETAAPDVVEPNPADD